MTNAIERRFSDDTFFSDGDLRIARINNKQKEIDVSAVLGQISQYVNIANIASCIQKGMRYVVQVPTHLQDDLASGKYSMLHGEKTGKTWATIVQKLPNGKNDFIANCPIVEEAFYKGNPIQDIANSFANLQLQKQMAALANVLNDTYEAIQRVEDGQKSDRIGQLIAGRDNIVLALKMNDEESRKQQIVIGRSQLQEAQGRIGEILKQKVNGFRALPKNTLVRFLKECTQNRYLDKRDDEYNIIQDYYELYLQATNLLAESYLICGEEESASLVFEMCRRFVADLDFEKVSTILYSHPHKTPVDLFFFDAIHCIELDKEKCMGFFEQYDYIELEVSGEEIMEVVSCGKKDYKEENG